MRQQSTHSWRLTLILLLCCFHNPLCLQVLQEKGLKTLAAGGADVMLNATVKEIKPGAAILADGTNVPFGLCFWAGGTEARKLTRDTITKVNR